MRAVRLVFAVLLSLTALLVTTLLFPGVSGGTAHAAEPAYAAEIRLTSFSPSLPQRDSTITVRGKVTNTSKKRLSRPRAYFWRNQAPITDNEGFAQALDSASNDPIGARKIASYDNLYDEDDPYLEPGESVKFTLRVNVADLELSPTDGIYLMGVHVLANDTPPAVARARVFVPILGGEPRNTQQMTSVVALNSRPSLVRSGVLVDDHLADEIEPGGRLDVLLAAAGRPQMSFAVDPALVEEVQTMVGGHQVLDGDQVEDESASADAERWLARLDRLLTSGDGYQLVYGSPDVAALAHHGMADVLTGAEEAAGSVQRTASLPLLVWPGAGAADAPTLQLAQDVRPAAVLLSDASTRASAPLLQPTAAGQAPIVSYTSAAFAGGPGPDPSDTPVHLQQRLLAESWLQAETAPAGSTLGHVRVISTASQASGAGESVKAPWIRQTTLSQLLARTPARWSAELHYSNTNVGQELSQSQLGSLNHLEQSWHTWTDLLVDDRAAQLGESAALARSASVRGRGSRAFPAYVTPQLTDLDGKLDSIQLSGPGRVLTPRSRVTFPITIRNLLPAATDPDDTTFNAVKVKLLFTSANRQRLTVQPIGLTTVAPGQNLQGNALVDARTNGTVRVTAQLYTESGRRVGRPKTVDVKATQAGTVGWFIAIGAGIVLVGSTALRIRQVSRDRARTAAVGDQDPIDVTGRRPVGDRSAESIDV